MLAMKALQIIMSSKTVNPDPLFDGTGAVLAEGPPLAATFPCWPLFGALLGVILHSFMIAMKRIEIRTN